MKPSRQVRRATARQSKTEQAQKIAQEILDKRADKVAEIAAAKAITKACLSDAEIQAWREDVQARLETIQADTEQNLGHIEEAVAAAAKEPLRLLAQRAAQAKANATPCQCQECQRELTDTKCLSRGIDSRFGYLVIWRGYGRCPKCKTSRFPADHALGLARNAPASPWVQEISALLVTKMPSEQAVAVAQRLGLDLSRCLLHREAHRQGLKAQERRAQSLAQLDTWEDLQKLAAHTEGPPSQPFTLVIEIDAWNIRERDNWGKTKELRDAGEKIERWHWVYMGTVFRLDHRGQTASNRAVISQRGYVATRLGLDALVRQLYREAIECGLGQAKHVLIIADGAVWIWNLAKDRFPDAQQRLDLWHAEEHLWELAAHLYGRGTPEAKAWVKPLLEQVRNDDTIAMIASLAELKPRLQLAQQDKLQTQIEYFENNADRMKYKEIIKAREAVLGGRATVEQIKLANQPLGSGAIESTCAQYQCRFKRTGQFWTITGDEALLCLETFWRNGRWHELFPHAKDNASLN
ncbi:MAG: hypothetical protein ACYC1M_19485 [Armatimonadota bacterium]